MQAVDTNYKYCNKMDPDVLFNFGAEHGYVEEQAEDFVMFTRLTGFVNDRFNGHFVEVRIDIKPVTDQEHNYQYRIDAYALVPEELRSVEDAELVLKAVTKVNDDVNSLLTILDR